MIRLFKCQSGFYAVTFYDIQLKTWLVYWSGSKDLNKAMLAAVECQSFIGKPDAAIIMCNQIQFDRGRRCAVPNSIIKVVRYEDNS